MPLSVGIGVFLGSQWYRSLSTPAYLVASNAYKTAVVTDGGTNINTGNIDNEFNSIYTNGWQTKIVHDVNATFGVKKDGSNRTSIAYCLSGNNQVNGTLANQPVWVDNSGDSYWLFNGTSQYFSGVTNRFVSGDLGTLDASKKWSFYTKVRAASLSSSVTIAGAGSSTKGFSVFILSSGLLQISMRNTTSTNELRVLGTTVLSTGVDYTIVANYVPNFSGGIYRASGVSVTINGTPETLTTSVDTLTTTDYDDVKPFAIGIRDITSPSQWFNGRIYYCKFFYNT